MTTSDDIAIGDRPPLRESLWQRDESTPLIDHTVGSLLADRARERPGVLALVGTGHGDGTERRLTYGELFDEAAAVSKVLRRLAGPGEPVALWAPNVIEWPIIEYGAALAGVILVALNPVLRQDDLAYALNHSGARVLLHADRSRDYDMAAVVAAVLPGCRELRHVISLSDWAGWLADATGDEPGPLPAADDPAMLQYTSGTTGNPKGVLLRHRSLVNVAKLTMEASGLEEGAVCVNPLPMFHTAACVIGTLGPLWLGTAAVLVERFDPAGTLATIAREDAAVLFFVPTILGALADKARELPDPPRLRAALGGAANLPPVLIESARTVFGATVLNLFGQTELAPVLSMTRPHDNSADLTRTVGRPLPQVDCKIIDPVTGATQPIDVPGEICARGYQQFIEYLGDPVATSHTVDADGWVHTGDLGAMDERGMLTVTGRLKELIIRGGENIAPAEIEACLTEHEAVAQAAVVGVPDARWGETVGAVVRLAGPARAGLRDELAEHCASRLIPAKVPQRWAVIGEFPMTPTGKLRKFELADDLVNGRLDPLA
ncbi:class I adenylate-forming enzyme family protein [Nocardia jinanensis]|uniref:AMP-binding protein n=1 Tax=Nocardia jinanensis TaxID=382504 RepID=A0A917RJL0_9NOCA|nr:AMP-binding protein [Nocardia jinanensis]GGL10032.1 AMP-binding protein [Nocardia jinanensis]